MFSRPPPYACVYDPRPLPGPSKPPPLEGVNLLPSLKEDFILKRQSLVHLVAETQRAQFLTSRTARRSPRLSLRSIPPIESPLVPQSTPILSKGAYRDVLFSQIADRRRREASERSVRLATERELLASCARVSSTTNMNPSR